MPRFKRAHEMLAGSWQILSINDKGETLGPRLIETRFARDGVLTVANRQMTIVNPATGEERKATFRINPSSSPRRIDLITTRNDRIFGESTSLRTITWSSACNLVKSRAFPTSFPCPPVRT